MLMGLLHVWFRYSGTDFGLLGRDVDDHSEGAELVLLTFAVALPSCSPFAGKDHASQAAAR